jgi:hypothetical protein
MAETIPVPRLAAEQSARIQGTSAAMNRLENAGALVGAGVHRTDSEIGDHRPASCRHQTDAQGARSSVSSSG